MMRRDQKGEALSSTTFLLGFAEQEDVENQSDFLQVSTHYGYIVTTNLVQIIKNKIQHSEFDYIALTDALSGYANPRNQISKLIRNGEIIRVKKGIYIFGPNVGAAPFSHAILAHWIDGPAYLSCETTLAYYGLIPERVEATISMTPKKERLNLKHLWDGLFTTTSKHPNTSLA
jgi:hypothetical protein